MGARAHLEPLDDGVFLAGFGKSSGYHDYGFCCWRGVDAESHIYAACGTSLKIRCTTSVFVCELCEWSQCWMQLHHPCHQRADHTRHSPLLRAVSSPPPAVPHGRHQHCSTFRDPSSDSGGTSHCSPDDRIRREAASAVILTQNNTPQSLLLFLEWFLLLLKHTFKEVFSILFTILFCFFLMACKFGQSRGRRIAGWALPARTNRKCAMILQLTRLPRITAAMMVSDYGPPGLRLHGPVCGSARTSGRIKRKPTSATAGSTTGRSATATR